MKKKKTPNMLFNTVTLLYTLIFLTNYVPRTCRTQPVSGAPVIMATKNLLAMTDGGEFTRFILRIEDLVNGSSFTANDYAAQSFKEINSSTEVISSKANSCVSNTAESIEKQFNETYISIESVLARINLDHKIAKTCLNEYEKTEMAFPHAIVIGFCVNQKVDCVVRRVRRTISLALHHDDDDDEDDDDDDDDEGGDAELKSNFRCIVEILH